MNLLSSTTIFSFITLLSRILGYLRDILIAIFLGASMYADAFFVAFRLPNTFRRLFAEGTFNSAFIPSFTKENSLSKTRGINFANEVFTLISLALLFLVLLAEIFTPFLVYLIAPGFFQNIDKFDLAVDLTRITFPFLFLVSLSSFFSGILNSYNRFAAAAAAPIILNIVLITSLLISFYKDLNFTTNLAIGVTFSGILQLIFLMYFTKRYYSPKFTIKYKIEKKVKFFLKKLLPSIFSSGITQINILVGTIIASFQSGAVSYLYYADRVYQINLAIAGIAVSTVSLPILSKAIKSKNSKKIMNIQNKSIELSLLLSIPACFGLIISSEQIISSLFGYGSFSIEDVKITADALVYFSLGIPAFALLKIFANIYFARDNTKTPFFISFVVVTINIIISLYYFKDFGFLIIPLATSISSWMGTIIYFYLLNISKFVQFKFDIFKNIFKIILSTIAMSLLLIYSLNLFDDKLNYTYHLKFLYLIIVIIIAAAFYLFLCYLFKILNLKYYRTS